MAQDDSKFDTPVLIKRSQNALGLYHRSQFYFSIKKKKVPSATADGTDKTFFTHGWFQMFRIIRVQKQLSLSSVLFVHEKINTSSKRL